MLWAAAAALLAAMAAQMLTAMPYASAVVDEPAHLTAGYLALARADLVVNREHPPLIKTLAALPLLLLHPTLPPEPPFPHASEDFEFAYSRAFLYRANDADTCLTLARLPIVLICVLTALVTFLWGWRIAGPAAGLVALVLVAFEPNLLAHGRLVTTDMGAAFFTLAVFACVERARAPRRPSGRRSSRAWTLLAGIAFGLALLTRYSCLLILPVITVSLLLDGRRARAGRWRLLLGLVVIGLVVVHGFYALFPGPGLGSPFPLAADPVGGPLRSEPLAFLEGHPILRWTPLPLPRLYLEGLDLARYKNMHVEGPGYLNGALSRNGWWSFFLLALTMKSTLPFLILAAGGIALAFVRPRAEQDTVHRAYIATPAIGLTLLITAFTHAQIGLRYILPVLVFLALAGSAAMMRLLGVRRGPGTSRSRIAGCLLAGSILFGWHAVSALRIHPYHLAYFNEAWGGPDKGYLHLVDSNLDWGQDLVGLRRFMDEHGLDGINLYYFGTADPRYYGIERYVPPRPGYFAVSVTHLMGVYLPDKRYLAPLRAVKPLTTIGHSIWVFKIGKVPDFLEVPPGPS